MLKAAILLLMLAGLLCLPLICYGDTNNLPAVGEGTEAQVIAENTYYHIADGKLYSTGASASNYNIYYANGEITLNNAALPTTLYVSGGTTVNLLGENRCTDSGTNRACIRVMTDGDLTIQGTGRLTSQTDEGIIWANVVPNPTGNLILKGDITLNMPTDYKGKVYVSHGDITIQDTVKFTGTAIQAQVGKVTITGNAQVEAKQILAAKTVTINGDAKVTVSGSSAHGIDGICGVEISGNAEVSASASYSALNATHGPITINSTKKLVATSTSSAAINAGESKSDTPYNITIKSEVEATGYMGICANGNNNNIIIDGAKVTVNTQGPCLYTQAEDDEEKSYSPTPGQIEIKNGAESAPHHSMRMLSQPLQIIFSPSSLRTVRSPLLHPIMLFSAVRLR